MKNETEQFVTNLVQEFPSLRPILAESLEDNFGEMLPHLVMSDIVRWLANRSLQDRGLAGAILSWLESAYGEGSNEVQELIVVSGVEMIPDPGDPGSYLRDLLGPQLRATDPWRGTSKCEDE
ncbi:DUF7674 family protein [Arthrobacter woluwensis]|uniref:DUF7674 family protein n=1 Tax=Arthrobacter woluwensis TaxID=156980 RepID=UPI001AAF939D|nr:hypothetical protein [Arthrobacter woluwensis]QTF73200.1 hypothetical protein G8758_15200 [Arthrobacter woluwensis]